MNITEGIIEKHFPPLGRHAYLDAESVKRLVNAVQLGRKCQGYLEKSRNNTWRLRVLYRLTDGALHRRGITLPDDDTAAWVKEYIANARVDGTLDSGSCSGGDAV